MPVPGWDVQCSTSTGQAEPGVTGRDRGAGCPCPPVAVASWRTTSGSSALPSRYQGHYLTGDGGYFDEDGYLFVMGRTDDVINVAGHRLSTGQWRQVLATHPAVAECAVIGVPTS